MIRMVSGIRGTFLLFWLAFLQASIRDVDAAHAPRSFSVATKTSQQAIWLKSQYIIRGGDVDSDDLAPVAPNDESPTVLPKTTTTTSSFNDTTNFFKMSFFRKFAINQVLLVALLYCTPMIASSQDSPFWFAMGTLEGMLLSRLVRDEVCQMRMQHLHARNHPKNHQRYHCIFYLRCIPTFFLIWGFCRVLYTRWFR